MLILCPFFLVQCFHCLDYVNCMNLKALLCGRQAGVLSDDDPKDMVKRREKVARANWIKYDLLQLYTL